jgi:hypothetical protein
MRRGLGLDLPYQRVAWMSAGELARARELISAEGLEPVAG